MGLVALKTVLYTNFLPAIGGNRGAKVINSEQ